MDDPSPSLLQAWVAERDEAAFDALVAQQRPMVEGVCRRVLGDGQAADDAVQDALVALSREAGSIRCHPGAWLRRTALHAALRRKRELTCGPSAIQAAAPAEEPGEDEERLRHLALVDECVARLSPAERDLIVALFYHQISQRELARCHGVSPARISQRLARTLDRLREDLRRRGMSLRRGALVGLLTCFGGGEALPMGIGAWAGWPAAAAAAAAALVLASLAAWAWIRGGGDGKPTSPPAAPAPVVSARVPPAPAVPLASAATSPAVAPASGPAPASLAAGGDEVWLAGRQGWNEDEWEVCLYSRALPLEAVWEKMEVNTEMTRPTAILPWRQAVGGRSRQLTVNGRQVLAFPMTEFDASRYCMLRCRDARGVASPAIPTRRRVTLVQPDGPDAWWAEVQTDWLEESVEGRWRWYHRESILACEGRDLTVGERCRTVENDRPVAPIGQFFMQPGVLMAEPSVRLLSPAESEEAKAACRRSAVQEQ
ncbi:MAG: sigma-70 family RNA polymerase sigma factor [Planctomycetes bacterium]|nr:sigma-70 family RNA polymerase sigma factor [Planctomycetota bacterium]